MRSDHRQGTPLGLMTIGLAGALVWTSPALAQERRNPPFDGFTPGPCAVAPPLVDWLSRRDHPDTTAYTPRKDTVWRSTTDSAGVCDDTYHGITEEERELLNLARVKLARGNDAQAAKARQRYLATLASRSAREQAWAYYLIVLDNLEAKPPRLVGAREALVTIDHLPFAEAWKASFFAHVSVANEAYALWDEPLAIAEANVAIAQYRQLTADQKQWFSKIAAGMFEMKAEQDLRRVGIAQAKAVLDTARVTIPSQSDGYRGLMQTVQLYATLGQPAASIEAKFWFRAPDTMPRPGKGRVTFISIAGHNCGWRCFNRYRALGRYVTRFGDRRFELVNTTETRGFYADTAPVMPQDEARYDSLYFLGYKKLPGMLAVVETPYTWRARDGRRLNAPTPQESHYPLASVILVDKRGIVRYVAVEWGSILEEPLAQLIERLLAEPANGTP